MSCSYDISVIIPVYNGEKFIEDCFASIVKQTIFEQLEVIFIDDASTDNTLNILEEYSASFDNITVLKNQVNLRQGGARNKGIERSSGNYIGFVDADDIVAPDYFETLQSLILKYGADVAYVKYQPIPEDSRYSAMSFKLSNNSNKLLDFSVNNRELFLISEIGTVWSGLYKKDLIIRNNVVFPEKHRYEDNYWVSIMKCYFNRIAISDDYYGYFYRTNGSSTTHLRNSFELINERIDIEKKILLELKNRQLYNKYESAFEYLFIKRYAFGTFISYLRMFSTLPYDKIYSLKREFMTLFPQWRDNKYLKSSDRSTRMIFFLFGIKDGTIYSRIIYRLVWMYYKNRGLLKQQRITSISFA